VYENRTVDAAMIMRHEKITGTKFVIFDANKCEACWKCLNVCINGTIDKINLFFHKHARIAKPEKCKGCLKCVKICTTGAFTRV